MRYLIVFLFLVLLGCQTVKEKTSIMADFFDAIGSGDIEFLKKHKKAKEVDDGSWDEIDKEKEGTE